MPDGLSGRVLGLQGAIGNRAVGLLLRQTDPRLTYTAAAVAEGVGLDATPLPFTAPGSGNPDAGWDSNAILSKRNLAQTNHYVVVGKDAGGQAFLYDPYPRVGTQFLRSNAPQQAFWTLFENAQGDWKSVYIFARPKFA